MRLIRPDGIQVEFTDIERKAICGAIDTMEVLMTCMQDEKYNNAYGPADYQIPLEELQRLHDGLEDFLDIEKIAP